MNYSAKLFDCRTIIIIIIIKGIYIAQVLHVLHVLHALLPPSSTASQRYNLGHRAHSLQLPEHSAQLSDSIS